MLGRMCWFDQIVWSGGSGQIGWIGRTRRMGQLGRIGGIGWIEKLACFAIGRVMSLGNASLAQSRCNVILVWLCFPFP